MIYWVVPKTELVEKLCFNSWLAGHLKHASTSPASPWEESCALPVRGGQPLLSTRALQAGKSLTETGSSVASCDHQQPRPALDSLCLHSEDRSPLLLPGLLVLECSLTLWFLTQHTWTGAWKEAAPSSSGCRCPLQQVGRLTTERRHLSGWHGGNQKPTWPGMNTGSHSETRAVGGDQVEGLGVSQDGCPKIQVSLVDFDAEAAHH